MSAVHPLSGLPVDAIAALAQLNVRDNDGLFQLMVATPPCNGIGCTTMFWSNISAYYKAMHVNNAEEVAKETAKRSLISLHDGMPLQVRWEGDDKQYTCTLHWCAVNGLHVMSSDFEVDGKVVLFNPWLDEWRPSPSAD